MGVAMAGPADPLDPSHPQEGRGHGRVPVLPADTMADALPELTASAARTTDESFMALTLLPGSASIGITSLAAITSRPWASPSSSGRPTSTTGTPSSSAARRAPATTSAGP